MNTIKPLFAVAAAALLAFPAYAQTARDIRGPAPVLAIANEPPPKLIVDPPLPEPLKLGRVVIQYRTENLRIVPVFGAGALDVSPRIGHIHVHVDHAAWRWADASGEPLIINGLTPGPHSVTIDLVNPIHKTIETQDVNFVIPEVGEGGSEHSH